MECLQSKKTGIRSLFREIRAEISEARRQSSSERALLEMRQMMETHQEILSYAPLAEEFSTASINHYLAAAGKLVLPRVSGDHLVLHRVCCLQTDLALGAYGLLEPIQGRCPLVSPSSITMALIPAIAFDEANHRIGYGKGCYDRFLCQLPANAEIIGIGFLEQFSTSPLPVEPHDRPLHRVCLF